MKEYPLLLKFKEVAPGSFKHCQTTAVICETIARQLNIDSDLMECMATYHDIGKMLNPTFFSENLKVDEPNPHKDLHPFMSYQIITRHVSDGAMILLQHDFPMEVVKAISEHHGNMVCRYFYRKAKIDGEELCEDQYRYPGRPFAR